MPNCYNNENIEWYTPTIIIEAVRESMGSIDLDVASCEEANQVVRASRYFTIEDDGLSQQWSGNVWCNPPYIRTRGKGQPSIFDWWQKIRAHREPIVSLLPCTQSRHTMGALYESDYVLFIDYRLKCDWWGSGYVHRTGARTDGPWNYAPALISFRNCEPSEYARKLGAVR